MSRTDELDQKLEDIKQLNNEIERKKNEFYDNTMKVCARLKCALALGNRGDYCMNRTDELEQKLEDAIALVEQLKKEIEQEKNELWRADNECYYFHLSPRGRVIEQLERNHPDFEDILFEIGNYYKSNELAQRDAIDLRERGVLRQLRDKVCEGYQFTPGSFSHNWTVIYHYEQQRYVIKEVADYIGGVFFDTQAHAEFAAKWMNDNFKGKKKRV